MRWLSPSARHVTVAGRHRAARHAGLLLLSGLFLVGAPSAVTLAQSAPVERPGPADPYAAHIAEAAQRFGIPAAWIRAVMRVESANDVRAVSPKGAMSLMQIMPETWAGLRIRYSLGTDPFNPRDNILAGAAYLREMHDRYGSPGFLAAYNAGPGRYEEYLAGRPLPAETRAYVAALLPIFGGDELVAPATIVAAADPRAWTRAPLFIGQSERTPAADTVQRGGHSRRRADSNDSARCLRHLPAIGRSVRRSYSCGRAAMTAFALWRGVEVFRSGWAEGRGWQEDTTNRRRDKSACPKRCKPLKRLAFWRAWRSVAA